MPGHDARDSRIALRSTNDWLEEATARCAAVVMVGGHAGRLSGAQVGGALGIVNRFMEEGKPVFPIPFSGGRSDEVFQAVLSRWGESPVPGLSRDQFLRLGLPWTTGTAELGDLLLGTLAETPDVFISYRRDDTAWAAGRLHRELSDRLGAKRVFMDVEDMVAGEVWKETIARALHSCRVGVVLIGNHWLDTDPRIGRPRVHDENDTVRMEIRTLLERQKPVIVVVAGAAPPTEESLPGDLQALSRLQALAVTNATWRIVVEQMIGTIARAVSAVDRQQEPTGTGAP
jgi:hypothetical protein